MTLRNRMTSNAVCVWDFTIPETEASIDDVKLKLATIAKKWCFQLEQGETTGYKHYQGRMSLKTKVRKNGAISSLGFKGKVSITSNENKDNDFYACKEETRIDGPWRDDDQYIPRQVRGITPLPWQQKVIDSKDIFDTRKINVIIDEDGNIGKSVLKTYISVHKIGRALPPLNDYKDVMRVVMDTKKVPLYIFDLPRAMPKKCMANLYSAIESIKDGYAFDDRYNFRDEYFDCPVVWVFTNICPNFDWLSKDRWRLYYVKDNDFVETESLGASL